MRPTMADVAEKVGVSISTVSLVLNDKPGISPDLRDQVLKAVEQVGYRLPGRRTAKALTESNSITVVHYAAPQSHSQAQVSGVFADFVGSIREFYQDKNANLTLITNYRDDDRNNLGYHLLEANPLTSDGFILMGIWDPRSSFLQRVMNECKPVIVLSRTWNDLPISTVSQDHVQQTNIALDYLIQLGHRKIAFIAREVDQEFNWYQTRLDLYRAKMENLGQWDENFVSVASDAGEATKTLLARHPEITALFAIHDENAVVACQALLQMGYRIPEDISVIGLDNSVRSSEQNPALTTVGFAHDEIGRLASKLLLEQIENPNLAYAKLFVSTQLIERASCAKPRG